MALFGRGTKQLLDEIKNYLDKGKYEAAMATADRVAVHKLKAPAEWNIVGRAYKKGGDFARAKELLECSYEARCSRVVLSEVLECCLELGDVEAAEKYFNEYQRISPEDTATLYVYRYRIEKKKGRDRQLLISILEELKTLDYTEEYAYELAKQYHKAGMAEQCMTECQDIILWFGTGAIVERARALLAYYKGELSLEDIKAAGERYIAKQKELETELQQAQEEAAAAEEASESAESDVPGDEFWENLVRDEEEPTEDASQQTEETEEPEKEAEEAEALKAEPEDREEELPVIDLSGIEFPEDVSAHENAREEKDFFEPAYCVPEEKKNKKENDKLTRLMKEKKIYLPDEIQNFARIEQVHKQVMKSLELVLTDREKAYFVITGEKKTGKTTFAFYLVKLLYHLGIVRYDRTATISAIQLNQISIDDYKEELQNCNLVIENAGSMTQETIDALLRFSKGRRGSICVILEDTTRSINKFLRAREDLNALFNNRIHLGKYNAGDLLGFAYDYIKKQDYSIDKLAAEALSKKIDTIILTYGDEERLLRALEVAAAAIACAEKRNEKILLEMAVQGRFREGNYLVIIEEDVV